MDDERHITIKCSLSQFCKDPSWITLIQQYVSTMNRIVTEGYHLLNYHVLRSLEEGAAVPPLNSNYLRQFMLAMSHRENKQGREPKIDESIIHSKKLMGCEPADGLPCRDYLSECIGYAAIDMETAIKNNIKMHFFKRQYKYLRKVEPTLGAKELYQLQRTINDVIGPCDHITLPTFVDKSVPYDLETHPEKFLLPMLRMNQELEAMKAKTFSLLPLRRGFQIRSLHIDHECLAHWARTDPLGEDYWKERNHKDKERKKANKNKEKKKKSGKEEVESVPKRKRKLSTKEREERGFKLWNKIFDLDILKVSSKYKFAYHITTDGVSISALFTQPGSITYKKRKAKKKNASPDDEEEEDASRWEYMEGTTIVGVDPGKNSILYMTTDDEKIEKRLRYTNVQRRVETGAKYYSQKIQESKTELIRELEATLSKENSRSPSTKGFILFLTTRREVESTLYEFYANVRYRIYRWNIYKGKQKSESDLVRNIKQTFGRSITLAYGDWNNSKQMKGCIPSPCSGIRNMLKKHFDVVDVHEFRTTKTCSKCLEGEMTPVRKRVIRRGHANRNKEYANVPRDVRGLRRCNNEECAVLFNRDYNAAMNIRKNLLHRIHKGRWHPAFARTDPLDRGSKALS